MLALALQAPDALAYCFRTSADASDLILNFGDAVSVGTDTPVGTTLASIKMAVPTGGDATCTPGGNQLSTNALRSLAKGQSNIMDTGVQGVGLRLRFFEQPSWPVPQTWWIGDARIRMGYGSYTSVRAEAVKTDALISSGPAVAGDYATFTLPNGQPLLYVSIAAGGLVIRAAACQTPDVTVDMGRHEASSFTGVGSASKTTTFKIALNSCPAKLSRIKYRIDPVTTVLDVANSVVALDSTSTAKGVGLQLMDDKGVRVPLSTLLDFKNFTSQGGDFNIPLSARYYQTESTIGPGSANTSMVFTMSYQ